MQGRIAIIQWPLKPLKMKESENRIFHFPCSEKSRMDLFRAQPKVNLETYRHGRDTKHQESAGQSLRVSNAQRKVRAPEGRAPGNSWEA